MRKKLPQCPVLPLLIQNTSEETLKEFWNFVTPKQCIISLHQETICDALAQNVLQNFVSKSGSSPQMHARWQHQIPSITMLRVGGRFVEFDAEFKFAKIQNSYVEGGWAGGGSQNLMLSSNLLKSKIPMLRVGGREGAHRIRC